MGAVAQNPVLSCLTIIIEIEDRQRNSAQEQGAKRKRRNCFYFRSFIHDVLLLPLNYADYCSLTVIE